MNTKLFKLAKLIVRLASIKTDKAELHYDGDLMEGVEVFVEKENEFAPAEDGEYIFEEKVITVKEGKILKIEEKQEEVKEEEVIEELLEDGKDVRIAELEATVAERDKQISDMAKEIEERDNRIKELEEQLAKPVAEPAQQAVVEEKLTGVARYF